MKMVFGTWYSYLLERKALDAIKFLQSYIYLVVITGSDTIDISLLKSFLHG